MATIEERAIQNAINNGYKDKVYNASVGSYMLGATEQHKIDIDNACKEFMNFLNARVDNPNYQLRKEDFSFWVEDFRKALEQL